jgi:hypothetical protein
MSEARCRLERVQTQAPSTVIRWTGQARSGFIVQGFQGCHGILAALVKWRRVELWGLTTLLKPC